MKLFIKKFHLIFILIIILQTIAYSKNLYFTYIGINGEIGYNKIKYNDFIVNEQKTIKSNGLLYGAGITLNLFLDNFAGELNINYKYFKSNSDPDLTIGLLVIQPIIKYLYQINNTFTLSAGAGLYLDSPPSTKSYNGGAGVTLVLGTYININREIKTFINTNFSYSSFGMGDSSKKMESGIQIGAIYKVGRL